MKTKWGSCNDRAGSIRLNTDLVVHETVHLLEPTHNARFIALNRSFAREDSHKIRFMEATTGDAPPPPPAL
jgi:predicted metal-dependent hydrolase